MSQAIANPEELRRFAMSLKKFNNDLMSQMTVVHGQLSGLSSSWRDREHDKFVEEFEQTMQVIGRFIEATNEHVPFLLRKAQRVEDYLQQRYGETAMSQANVRSVEALKDFKNALIAYAEEARNALSGVDMDVRRTRDWLERDQLMYWQTQVKKRNEAVSQARADLFRRQISQGNSGSVSDADQKETLRIAIQRLRQAEEKMERVRKWGPVLQHAIAEYNATARPLGDRIAGDLVASLALLDRMVASLDAYMALKAPTLRPDKTSSASETDSATASVGHAASVAQPVQEGEAPSADGAGAAPADGETEAGGPAEETQPNENEVVTP